MALSLFTRNKKAIVERAQDDYATKMRLKYKPYYHAMDSQRGTHIQDRSPRGPTSAPRSPSASSA